MMRDIFIPHLEEIPQWKQCYYDYQTLGELYQFMKSSTVFLTVLYAYRKKLKATRMHNHDVQITEKLIARTERLAFQCDQKFYLYSQRQTIIIYMFGQYKSFQLRRKFLQYQIFFQALPLGDTDFLVVLQNSYIESYYLKNMLAFNLAKQQSMIIRFRELTRKFKEISIFIQPNRRLHLIKYTVNKLSEQLEDLYLRQNEQQIESAEVSLKQNNDEFINDNRMILLFGVLVGVILTALCMLITYVELEDANISEYQYDTIFPIWRGASYLVFYVWVLGCDVILYEVAKIDYKLILRTDYNYHPRGSHILFSAAFFTCIYIIFFFLYELQSTHVIGSNFNYHWAGASWLIFIVYIFLPLPILQYKGRFYFLKLLVKAFLSPFVTITFLHIYVMEQMVSFNQPFADFAYTICKYVNFQNDCKISGLASMIILITFFSIRIIQSIKFACQQNLRLWSGPYMGSIRATLSINTVIASYLFKSDETLLPYWVTFAILLTFWAWFVDVKFDWGLLSFDDNSIFLRKRLMLKNVKFVYIFMILLNFVLRCAWVLTISPYILTSLGLNKQIFIMILSFMQILRRGVWNFFRIQNQHVNHCQRYQANVDDSQYHKRLQVKYKQKTNLEVQISKQDQIRIERQREQKKILSEEIAQCKKQRQQMIEFVKEATRKMKRIRKRLPEGYIQFQNA